jgi:hypothetical protein
MASRLITQTIYHLGPKIEEERIETARGRAALLLDQAYRTYNLLDRSREEPDAVWIDARVPSPLDVVLLSAEAHGFNQCRLRDLLYEVEHWTNPDEVEGEENLKAIIDVVTRKSRAVDWTSRYIGSSNVPDLTIIVAGDMTWGTEPDGAAYHAIKAGRWLGLLKIMGCY